jgi:class 3 adenylate cyclase
MASVEDPDRAGLELPVRTVTFLLTDIEGSTHLWGHASEAMAKAVAEQHAILSQAVAHNDGARPQEQGEGEGVVAAFACVYLSSPQSPPTDICFSRTRPTITDLSPNSGSTAGDTSVTVTGSWFALSTSATKFRFGAAKATSVNCISSTTCTVVSRHMKSGRWA